MRAHNEQGYRTVERMTEGGRWVRTVFEDLREGEIVRFFDTQCQMLVEQNGATVFIVVSEARQVGSNGNVKISVIPFESDRGEKALTQCPYFENIVVRPYGMGKLIEATGCCAECSNMRVCLKARHSSAYFEQLRGAFGLEDAGN